MKSALSFLTSCAIALAMAYAVGATEAQRLGTLFAHINAALAGASYVVARESHHIAVGITYRGQVRRVFFAKTPSDRRAHINAALRPAFGG